MVSDPARVCDFVDDGRFRIAFIPPPRCDEGDWSEGRAARKLFTHPKNDMNVHCFACRPPFCRVLEICLLSILAVAALRASSLDAAEKLIRKARPTLRSN